MCGISYVHLEQIFIENGSGGRTENFTVMVSGGNLDKGYLYYEGEGTSRRA